MKILLVDDDADLLAVTGFALQQAGFLVVKAADGIAALEAFEREHPHLAVLDINMPRMSGFDLAQKLRERSRIPLLMLTDRPPHAVIEDEHHDAEAVLRGGAQFLHGHLEAAVTRVADDCSFRKSELRGDCRGQAIAHRTTDR